MREGKGRRIDGTRGREAMCVCATRERGRWSGCSRRYSDGRGEGQGGAAHGQPSEKGEGEKKGVKNVGAEETGGKNRAVSTRKAAGVRGEKE